MGETRRYSLASLNERKEEKKKAAKLEEDVEIVVALS